MRVLIVDDDPALTNVFRRCLSLWGWELDISHTVSHAAELFERAPYDAALCDVDLPDGDGVVLAKALSRSKQGLKIVIVSGDAGNIARAQAAGFTACLRKPFDLDELKGLLGEGGIPQADRA